LWSNFLKQKFEKIKKRYTIESMNHGSCKQASCICKNKTLEKSKENLEYAFFIPSEENEDKIGAFK